MTDYGEITPCYTVTFERRSKHPPSRLWKAITDPAQVATWMDYEPVRIDLRPGGDYYIDFGRTNEGALDGVIIRVEPDRKLAYAWGTSVVEWSMEPDGEGSRYIFIQTGLAFRDIDDEEGLPAGWHEFLDRFVAHLDGRYFSRDESKAAWEALKPAYRERLDLIRRR